MDKKREGDEKISWVSISLPRNSGVRPTNKPATNGYQAVDQGIQEPDAFAAKDALQHHMTQHGDARKRRVSVMGGVHRARS